MIILCPDLLEPSKGWLWTPTLQIASPTFRPLPAERGMTVREIEDRFLRAIAKADFLYVYCPEGYIGASAGFEVGYALASETPVYASDPPDFIELAGGDLELKAFLEQSIMVAGVAQAAQLERAKRDAAN